MLAVIDEVCVNRKSQVGQIYQLQNLVDISVTPGFGNSSL